ncbi:MAG: heme A synthase [Inquilinus sp.]|nr:heme A synthase [Inquilinus sp.]
MVFAMAVIGAITRLTESGLSSVEWRPLSGALPPLSDAEWQRVFDLYRETPEYRLRNAGMELAAFKQIFFWEWFHRLWGRLIGLVFALPFLAFWATGRIARPLLPRLLGLLLLGALQGGLGWFMVLSGLVDQPAVSHYRLAAHLGLAIAIYALLLWQAWLLLFPADARARPAHRLGGHAVGALALLAATILWGAMVAGLDAGLAYNTWPLMGGTLLPPEAWSLQPQWLNFLDNTALVQFTHRWLAIATAAAVIALWWRARRPEIPPALRRGAGAAAAMAGIQAGLGIATLLAQVPVWLGALHQGGALVLLGLLLWCIFVDRRLPAIGAPGQP